jgi:hypothetical protein
MIYGVACLDSYDGPQPWALEFSVTHRNKDRIVPILDAFPKVKNLSCHLPPHGSVAECVDLFRWCEEKVPDRIQHYVVHITKQSPLDSWQGYIPHKNKILIENHNQELMDPNNAGLCWPEHFTSIVDAGFSLNLDLGHILMCALWAGPNWTEIAEKTFEEFLKMPIKAAHVHTMTAPFVRGNTDHSLVGWDIGPWVQRLIAKHPEVVLVSEGFVHNASPAQQLDTMRMWIGRVGWI